MDAVIQSFLCKIVKWKYHHLFFQLLWPVLGWLTDFCLVCLIDTQMKFDLVAHL